MKRLTISLLLLGCVVLGVNLLVNHVLRNLTDRAITYAPAFGREVGLVVELPQAEQVSLTGIRSVAWRGLSARAKVVSAVSVSRPGARYYLTIDYVGATLLSVSKVLVEIEGARIDPIPEDESEFGLSQVRLGDEFVPGRIEVSSLHFILHIDSFFKPGKEVRKVVDEVRKLFTGGRTAIGMTVRGRLEYALGDTERHATIITDTKDSEWVFLLDTGDILNSAHYFEDPIVEAEAQLIAEYPFRAAEMFGIRDKTKQAVIAVREKTRGYPEEAYRQVLWSYLLSRRFSPEFAERITESYQSEISLDDPIVTMNSINQRVGREWAEKRVVESDIEQLVQLSDEVIRHVRVLQASKEAALELKQQPEELVEAEAESEAAQE